MMEAHKGRRAVGFAGVKRMPDLVDPEWRAVDQGDDAAGMGVEAEVAGIGCVTDHHLAVQAGLSKPRHGVRDHLDMVWKQADQGFAQAAQGGLLVGGEAGEVGFDRPRLIRVHSAAFI
jgi:hypothetical protein